jgi:hypothetical protein
MAIGRGRRVGHRCLSGHAVRPSGARPFNGKSAATSLHSRHIRCIIPPCYQMRADSVHARAVSRRNLTP